MRVADFEARLRCILDGHDGGPRLNPEGAADAFSSLYGDVLELYREVERERVLSGEEVR